MSANETLDLVVMESNARTIIADGVRLVAVSRVLRDDIARSEQRILDAEALTVSAHRIVALIDAVRERDQEIARLAETPRYAACIYCGHRVPYLLDDSDDSKREAYRRLIEHDRQCPKNPLVADAAIGSFLVRHGIVAVNEDNDLYAALFLDGARGPRAKWEAGECGLTAAEAEAVNGDGSNGSSLVGANVLRRILGAAMAETSGGVA
ncbi:MAG TPA: hypothetical protein VN513_12340 [Gemmatimonadales bacterium]|nr:hypothetical protein [Gemmatimonadales bacterium]